MIQVIIGTQGSINARLARMNDFEFISAAPFGDGKVLIVVKGKAGERLEAGEVQIKEVIKEVIKDNPKHLVRIDELNEIIIEKEDEVQTLQDALSDALNAEEKAKKEATDLKKTLKELKTKFTNLKKKFLEED